MGNNGGSRRFVTLVGSCLAVVLVSTGAGCGTQQQPASEDLDAARAMDARLLTLTQTVGGSLEQRSAGQYLGFRRTQDPIAACMHAKDLPYDAHYVDSWLGRAGILGSEEVWTAPLDARVISVNARGTVPSVRLFQHFLSETPDEGSVMASDGYTKAVSQCEKQVGLNEGDVQPKGASQLSSELNAVVVQVDHQFGSSDPYDACMKDEGFDTTVEDVSGYQGLYASLEAEVPDDVPALDEPVTEQWQAFVDHETAALAADRKCRGANHVAAMAALAPVLDDFEAGHRGEIDRIADRWQEIVHEARAMGWKPIPGSAGT